jgi:hypothetical protein
MILIILNHLNIINEEISNYSFGLVTEIIGIIITVIFVDLLFKRKNLIDEKNNEAKSIMRMHKIFKLYFNDYRVMYNCVVTPIKDRHLEMKAYDNGNFELKDMSDLYKISTIFPLGMFKPVIESFIEMEHRLRYYIISMLSNIDFKYDIELSDILIDFIKISITYDSSSEILDIKNQRYGEKKAVDIISEDLIKLGDDYYKKYLKGEGHLTLIHPFIFLYEMMKKEREVLLKYFETIKKYM